MTQRLTTNAAAGPVLERITINIGGGKVRKEKLEGRDHLVVPTVLLMEQVLNGSAGPIFYPHAENKKAVAAWNHMPIVVNHPEVDGTPVSARSPDELNSRKVGVVLNSEADDATKKVKAECWFDVDRLKATDVRIYNNVLKEIPTESSTGLFLNADPVKGKFGDASYDHVARDQNPDHLAVLPDKVGALSIKMGGGLFANSEKLPEACQAVQQRTAENALKAVGIEFVGNELSFNTVTRHLSDILARNHGEKGRYWEGWVEDVFGDHVIFRDKGKTWRQDYTANDKGVSLKGSAVEVVRTVSYTPAAAANAAGHSTESKTMDRTAKIASLIGNGYAEADRVWLDKLDDATLANIKPVTANAAATPPPAPTVTLPTANGNVVVTREAILAALPADEVAVLNYGKQQLAQQRTMLINALKGTGRCKFTDKYLTDLPLAELQAMVEMAGGQAQAPAVPGGQSPFVPGYFPGMPVGNGLSPFPYGSPMPGQFPFPGMYPGPVNYGLANPAPAPVGNAAGKAKAEEVEDDDGLDAPTINFGKNKVAG